ncbi:MAG: radical SAM-associated putative lipoprotein [Spirochaetes bacterium]|nr:radical SAM-associated putative lipoprotein [Spirochaetota bacterium]
MKLIKKIILSIVTGTSSLIIAACYGMPSLAGEYRPFRIKVKDDSNIPISGLEVKVNVYNPSETIPFDSQTGTTDELGEYIYNSIDASYKYTVDISDVDGEANGGDFASKTIEITDILDYDVELVRN